MIEVYSKNVSANVNELIPLNRVAVKKGTTVTNSGSYEIVFNQCGIYQLTVSATAGPQTATSSNVNLSIKLIKDGVEIPQAAAAALTDNYTSLSFSTLVQVNRNNSPCVCSTPVVCSIKNTGVDAVYETIDVVVIKII